MAKIVETRGLIIELDNGTRIELNPDYRYRLMKTCINGESGAEFILRDDGYRISALYLYPLPECRAHINNGGIKCEENGCYTCEAWFTWLQYSSINFNHRFMTDAIVHSLFANGSD